MDTASLDMTNIRFSFNWTFSLSIINAAGKKHKNHLVSATGSDYRSAKGDMEYLAKKRRYQVLKINSATVKGIEYAYYTTEGHPIVPAELRSQIPIPEIPQSL